MFLYGRRYVQLIGVGLYGLDNTVGSVVFIFQLPAQVCSSPVSSVNPNLIAWLESGGGHAVAVSTVCLPHLGVSHLHPGDFVDAFQSFRCHLSFPHLERIHSYIQLEVITRMVPKVGEERRQRGGVGYLVVACELRQKQIAHPIVLQIGDISPQVLFHHCVHPLSLSISLSMKSGREV